MFEETQEAGLFTSPISCSLISMLFYFICQRILIYRILVICEYGVHLLSNPISVEATCVNAPRIA